MIERNELQWIKKGDFNESFKSENDLTHQVIYISSIVNKSVELTLSGYGKYKIGISISAPSPLKKLLTEALMKEGFSLGVLFPGMPFKYVLDKNKIEGFADYLNIVDQFLPIKNIKKELFDTIGIKAIPNESEFYDQLEQFILENKIDQALKIIAEIDNEHVSWKLANLLEKHGKFPEALDLYQDITVANPHYSEANQQAANILLQREIASPDMTLEEKNKNLEFKVRFMLRADKEDSQRLLDQRFSELSANPAFNPCVKNVKINEETLIALVHRTASLQEEIAILRATVAQLKANPGKSPDSFFHNKPTISTEEEMNNLNNLGNS